MGKIVKDRIIYGGIDSALQNKVGSAPLDTVAQDLSGAVNELKASGGGTITDVQVDGVSVVTSGVAEIDLTPYVAKSGDTMTGQLKIIGSASSQPLQTRGITGISTDGTALDGLYLQYGNTTNDGIIFGQTGGGSIYDNGTKFSGSSDLNVLKSGDTMTGTLTTKNGRVSFIKGRDGAGIKNTAYNGDGAWYPVSTVKSKDGSWEYGTLSGSNNLYFSYAADSNYSANSNKSNKFVLTPIDTNDHSYTIAHSGNVETGDSNGQVKIAGTNVSVKGLGSAAYLTANTAASNSTVVQRNSSGYVYANYFNTTCAEVNPSSYTNPRGLFVSSDGFIRKATATNFRDMIGAGTYKTTWPSGCGWNISTNPNDATAIGVVIANAATCRSSIGAVQKKWTCLAGSSLLAKNKVNDTISLSESTQNFQMIAIRLGADTDNSKGGGQYWWWIPAGNCHADAMHGHIFQCNGTIGYITIKFTSVTAIKIIYTCVGGTAGANLPGNGIRAVYGLNY